MAVKAGYRYADDPNEDTTGYVLWTTSQGQEFLPPGVVPDLPHWIDDDGGDNQHEAGSGATSEAVGRGIGGGKRKSGRGGGGKRTASGGKRPRCPVGVAKRKAGGGPGGGGKRKACAGKRPRCPTGGGPSGGDGGSAGGGVGSGGGAGGGVGSGAGAGGGGGGRDGDDDATPMDVVGDDMSRADFGGGGGGSNSEWGDNGGTGPSGSVGGDDGGDSDNSDSGSGGSDSGSDDSDSDSDSDDGGSGSGGSGGGSGSGRGGGGRGQGRGGRGGGRCGRGRGGGGRGGARGAAGDRQADLRRRQAGGLTRVDSTELGRWLAEPVLPCLEAFIQNNRKISQDRADDHKGTAPQAKRRPGGVGTVADLAGPISLLSRESKDGFRVFDDLFFARASMKLLRRDYKKLPEGEKARYFKMENLKRHYELDYVFNPSDIGVVLGRTKVRSAGRDRKVIKFDHGEYILKGGKKVKQWELLENRRGAGVTLEQDLARYIRQLASTHTVAMGQVVPWMTGGENRKEGMLLDVSGGLRRARASGDKTDTKSKLKLSELEAIESKTDLVRQFSLEIFTKASVQDLLPKPDATSGEGTIMDFRW